MKMGPMRFAISPHEKAPMFLAEKNPELLVAQALSETQSLQTTESVRQLIRQTGLVNLWYFLKVIAGYNGPFNLITDHLHLDMANFCQEYGMVPGSFCAVSASRKMYKTTVCTTGFDSWECLRDPDITIGLYHSVYDEAAKFLQSIERIFDSNEFFAWVYPEWVPSKNQTHWNDKEMLFAMAKDGGPRTRHHKEMTIEIGSVGGTNQGRHYRKIDLDDIVGENDLDVERASNVDMERKKNWITGVKRHLIVNAQEDRVFAKFTRYAPDDAYEPIMTNIKKLIMYDENKLDPTYVEKKDGQWTVYYRFMEENGEIAFPESGMTKEILADILEEDPWEYYTQIENNPYKSGIAEFTEYKLIPFDLDYENDKGWIVRYEEPDKKIEIELEECDIVQAADPGGSERRKSSKTSRSAQGVIAHHWNDKRFICSVRAGYVDTATLFDWFFSDWEKFKNCIRVTLLEAQGPFKILGPNLRHEEERRNVYISQRPMPAVGKKEERIKAVLHPLFRRKLIYCRRDLIPMVNEELKVFPGGRKNDILDMIAFACANTNKPFSPEELTERAESGERRKSLILNAAGY